MFSFLPCFLCILLQVCPYLIWNFAETFTFFPSIQMYKADSYLVWESIAFTHKSVLARPLFKCKGTGYRRTSHYNFLQELCYCRISLRSSSSSSTTPAASVHVVGGSPHVGSLLLASLSRWNAASSPLHGHGDALHPGLLCGLHWDVSAGSPLRPSPFLVHHLVASHSPVLCPLSDGHGRRPPLVEKSSKYPRSGNFRS